MNVDNSNNHQDSTIQSNKQEPIVKSHAESLIEKILSDPSLAAQFKIACVLYKYSIAMTNIYEKLSLVRGELGLAAIEAGFKSADEQELLRVYLDIKAQQIFPKQRKHVRFI
ncbi:MAG: hypothetical protein LBC45_04000 [Chlamydiales bacterium]|jgi:hypothetical protein|nr:hypothetical protein [Chlamydiales bacterium]